MSPDLPCSKCLAFAKHARPNKQTKVGIFLLGYTCAATVLGRNGYSAALLYNLRLELVLAPFRLPARISLTKHSIQTQIMGPIFSQT